MAVWWIDCRNCDRGNGGVGFAMVNWQIDGWNGGSDAGKLQRIGLGHVPISKGLGLYVGITVENSGRLQ